MIKVRSTSTQRIESKTWDSFMLRHEQQLVFFFLKKSSWIFQTDNEGNSIRSQPHNDGTRIQRHDNDG